MGKVATSPLPPGGSPPLQSGGQNQKWQQSEMENHIFWGPHNKAWISEWGDNIRNSPQVGPMAIRSGKTYFLGKSFTKYEKKISTG